MRNKTVELIATNKDGATVSYTGKSKIECMVKFRQDYNRKGFKFEYVNHPKP